MLMLTLIIQNYIIEMETQEIYYFWFVYFKNRTYCDPSSQFQTQLISSNSSQQQQVISNPRRQNRKLTQLYQVFVEQIQKKHKNSYIKVWSKEQDDKILQFGKHSQNWSELSKQFVGKSSKIIRRRYLNLAKKEANWPNEIKEEIKYLRQIEKLSWIEIELHFKNNKKINSKYTAKQIRQKYKNFIQFQPNRTKWTLKEDLALWNKVSQVGKNWKNISKYFPQRTSLQIRNRYYKFLYPTYEKIAQMMEQFRQSQTN